VPARGGSKGVPGKNLRPLGGVPLALRTIDYALAESEIDDVLFSTDDPELARLVMPIQDFQNMDPGSIYQTGTRLMVHRRTDAQATDLARISSTLFDISRLSFAADYEMLLMLQPTSPLRFPGELHSILEIAQDDGWSSVVSVRDATNNHPERMYLLEGGLLRQYSPTNIGDNPPRQLLEPVFIKDGSFYLFRMSSLRAGIMLGEDVFPYVRSHFPSANIDTAIDFEFAEFLLNRGG